MIKGEVKTLFKQEDIQERLYQSFNDLPEQQRKEICSILRLFYTEKELAKILSLPQFHNPEDIMESADKDTMCIRSNSWRDAIDQ